MPHVHINILTYMPNDPMPPMPHRQWSSYGSIHVAKPKKPSWPRAPVLRLFLVEVMFINISYGHWKTTIYHFANWKIMENHHV